MTDPAYTIPPGGEAVFIGEDGTRLHVTLDSTGLYVQARAPAGREASLSLEQDETRNAGWIVTRLKPAVRPEPIRIGETAENI